MEGYSTLPLKINTISVYCDEWTKKLDGAGTLKKTKGLISNWWEWGSETPPIVNEELLWKKCERNGYDFLQELSNFIRPLLQIFL